MFTVYVSLLLLVRLCLYSTHDAFITIHQHKQSKVEEERGRRKANI